MYVFRQKIHLEDLFVFRGSYYLVLMSAGVPLYIRLQN